MISRMRPRFVDHSVKKKVPSYRNTVILQYSIVRIQIKLWNRDRGMTNSSICIFYTQI